MSPARPFNLTWLGMACGDRTISFGGGDSGRHLRSNSDLLSFGFSLFIYNLCLFHPLCLTLIIVLVVSLFSCETLAQHSLFDLALSSIERWTD